MVRHLLFHALLHRSKSVLFRKGLREVALVTSHQQLMLSQDWKKAHAWAERFEVSFDSALATQAKECLGKLAITVAEGTMLGLMLEKNITEPDRRTRLEKVFARISAQSKMYNKDIKMAILPCIVSQTVGKVLS